MPVRIIRVPRATPAPPEPPAVVEPPAPKIDLAESGATPHPRGWMVDGAILLAHQDFSEEAAYTKFLLHKVKLNMWYRLRWFREEERRMGLTSPVAFDFDCRHDSTTDKNYIMALLPAGTVEPSAELLAFVSRALPRLHSSAT